MEMVLCQQELGYYLLGLGVRLGEADSLSIAVGVQSARVWVMCGRVGSCSCTITLQLIFVCPLSVSKPADLG